MRVRSIKFIAMAVLLTLGIMTISVFGYFSFISANASLMKKYSNESDLVLEHTMHIFQYQFQSVSKAIDQLSETNAIYESFLFHNSQRSEVQFKIIQNMLPYGSSIQIGMEDGSIIMYPEMDIPKSYDPRKRNWYESARKSKGKIIWTEPYLDYMTQKIVITASKGLSDSEGKVIGVVAVNFDVSTISNLISHSRIGNDGFVMLLSNSGTVVANRDDFMIGEKVLDNGFKAVMENKNINALKYKFNGEQYYLYTKTIDENKMILVAAVSNSEIVNNLTYTLFPVLVTGIVCLIVFGSVAYISALKGIAPLQRLVHFMKQVEEGNYNVNAQINNYEEISSLSKSFNNMITGIRERDEQLRRQYDDLERSQRILKESKDRIKHMAFFDSLTGISNRVRLIDSLNNVLSNVSENDASGIVLYIDLDNFKSINDTMGHSVGDKLLVQVAGRLNSIHTEDKIVARIGGDEFIILVNNIETIDAAANFSQKVIDVFSEPVIIEGKSFYITTSMGVTLFPQHGLSADELLKKADMAMYKVKEKGKNGFHIFDQSLQYEIVEKVTIERELRSAIKNEELYIVYQPLYNFSHNKIEGFEALLRWNSPILGSVSPLTFIKIAEKTGLIVNLENWVIRNVCTFAKEINENSMEPVKFTINISPVHIMQRDFIAHITEIISEVDVNPCVIGLEITESVMMEGFYSNKEQLEKLKEIGISIYLDDFGSGYSSLNYLQKLPVDFIKIDKVFIDTMADSSKEWEITAGIIKLGHNIGMKVVAEGIETKEQFEMLKQYNCDYIQGYYVSKPLEKDKVFELLNVDRL